MVGLGTHGDQDIPTMTGSQNLLIHFSTDDHYVMEGFLARFHYIPHNANCAFFLNKTKLILTQANDCNWIITAPSMTGTITIEFQNLEVRAQYNTSTT